MSFIVFFYFFLLYSADFIVIFPLIFRVFLVLTFLSFVFVYLCVRLVRFENIFNGFALFLGIFLFQRISVLLHHLIQFCCTTVLFLFTARISDHFVSSFVK